MASELKLTSSCSCLECWFRVITLPHTQIFQKKKGKKRKPFDLVEGFKKASFLDEILPVGWRF
jgi:hypothetical protein